MRNKLYLAAGLTHASAEFKEEVLRFRDALESDFDVLKFVGISPQTPAAQVFEHDLDCVTECDVIVAVSDEVSTGMGMEIGYGLALGKRILAVAHQDALITKMVTGAGESDTAPTAHFARYENLVDDVIPMVHELFAREHVIDLSELA